MQTLVFPFLFIFSTIYLFGYFVIFRNRSSDLRIESCSCLISLFNGASTVILIAVIFSAADDGNGNPVTHRILYFLKTVLDLSTAFFVTDLLHFITASSGTAADKLLCLHHVVVLFVIAMCRYVLFLREFSVVLLILLVDEAASACQSISILAGVRRRKDFFSAEVYRAYSNVRTIGIFKPIFSAGGPVPLLCYLYWAGFVYMVLGVSFYRFHFTLHRVQV